MSANTIASSLGLLQDDPDHEQAWEDLRQALAFDPSAGTATPPEGSSITDVVDLLGSARRAHEMRREYEAVAELFAATFDGEARRHVADGGVEGVDADRRRSVREELDAAEERFPTVAPDDVQADAHEVVEAINRLGSDAARVLQTVDVRALELALPGHVDEKA